MTEKISPWLRCDARSMFGNMCIGATHTESTNHPTSSGRYAEGAGRRSRLRKFPPLSRHCRVLTVSTLSRTSFAFASLPTSSPALLPVSSSPFTDDGGVCVYRRQSPSTEGFSRFFSPRVYPTPEASQTVGATAMGVQRVQPSVLGRSLVSLVTAPHKGIAL